jgi:hypothetical protein
MDFSGYFTKKPLSPEENGPIGDDAELRRVKEGGFSTAC